MKSIHIMEDSLAAAWEKAVVACWTTGAEFSTQYDKPGDPPSKDVFATIHIKKPFGKNRIHRAIPGGMNDLEKYRSEVIYGCHDYWMDDLTNPHRWSYTYHQRIHKNNQLERCIDLLKKCPYTRRAKVDVWDIESDLNHEDPACLQELWLRVEEGRLNMVVRMRSNDAYKAAYMNMFAFTELQQEIARELKLEPGEYIHSANSFHIYGSYFSEFEGFLNLFKNRSPADRYFEANDPEAVIPFFIDGCDELLAEDKMPAEIRAKIVARKAELAPKA